MDNETKINPDDKIIASHEFANKTDKTTKITHDNEIIANISSTVLTDKYIEQSNKELGHEFYKCIFLKDISSFEYGYKSFPFLLFLSALCVIVFIVNTDLIISLVIGFVLFILFFITRQNAVTISAHNRETIVQPLGQKKNEAKDFIAKAIQAKKKIM